MYTFLKTLRAKPKEVRVLYAFWGALFVSLCVGSVWLFGFIHSLGPQKEEVPGASESNFWSEFEELFISLKGIPERFKGTVEYENPNAHEVVVPTLDLDALVSSSSREERR